MLIKHLTSSNFYKKLALELVTYNPGNFPFTSTTEPLTEWDYIAQFLHERRDMPYAELEEYSFFVVVDTSDEDMVYPYIFAFLGTVPYLEKHIKILWRYWYE